MKRHFYLMVLLAIFSLKSCSGQKKDSEILNQFMEKVILNADYDVSQIHKYLEVPKDSLLNFTETYKILKIHTTLIREQLKHKDYQIIGYNKMNSLGLLKSYHIDYIKPNELYFLVSDENIITSFLVKNEKLTSFFMAVVNPF